MDRAEKTELEQKLLAECERGYVIGPSAVGYLSVTAETFTEICGGQIHQEAGEIACLDSPQSAYDAALAAFKAYAADKSGTLYWRTKPELGENNGRFAFYMRLLISDAPVIAKRLGIAMEVVIICSVIGLAVSFVAQFT